ncbi:MAG: hypothetical protein Kow0031_16420 [Anaerolineae bacterium]
MTTRQISKLVHVGDYVAEVDVTLIYTEDDWSPYLSLADAHKLDDVRTALHTGNLDVATRLARVFKLTPVTVA